MSGIRSLPKEPRISCGVERVSEGSAMKRDYDGNHERGHTTFSWTGEERDATRWSRQ